MTEVRAIVTRKQLHHIPHLHFHVRYSRQGVLRFPFGENEALCFAIQYVNETAHGRICWQRYKIFVTKQHLKAKKVVIFCQNSTFSVDP